MGGILSHSFLIYNKGSLCCASKCATYFQVLTVFYNEAKLLQHVQIVAWHWRPWKSHCLDGRICFSKTCMYFSAFTDVDSTYIACKHPNVSYVWINTSSDLCWAASVYRLINWWLSPLPRVSQPFSPSSWKDCLLSCFQHQLLKAPRLPLRPKLVSSISFERQRP